MTTPKLRRICVFCGARHGNNPAHAALARETGRRIALRALTVVYGGGGIGLMKEVADGALNVGGQVVGVIPRRLVELEQAHGGLTDLRIVETMLDRKRVMLDLSDAFITLPGGIGTLDEFFEVLTAVQLRFHAGPCALVNPGGFFDPLLEMLDVMVARGFWSRESRDRLIVVDSPLEALDRFAALA